MMVVEHPKEVDSLQTADHKVAVAAPIVAVAQEIESWLVEVVLHGARQYHNCCRIGDHS